jgi:hypothetical protein
VAGRDPKVPKHPIYGMFEGVHELLLTNEDRFQIACLQARRSGDLGPVIALLRSYYPLDKSIQRLADLLERAKLKRPRGNPRGEDPWVAFAADLARYDKKIMLPLLGRFGGWKKSKDVTVDDLVINRSISYMREHGYPMRPDEETFKDKVRNKLHQSRRPRKGEIDEVVGTKIGDSAFFAYMQEQGSPNEEDRVRTKRRSRPPRKRK